MHKALTPIGEYALKDIWETAQSVSTAGGKQLRFMSCKEFIGTDFTQSFLVKRILTDREPAVIGGPRKTLKTSFAMDLAVSVASGKRFLGEFEVPNAMPVGVISGESGGAALKNTLIRVCHAKEIQYLGRLPLYMMLDMPSLQSDEEMDVVCRMIEEHQLRVVILDPLYLMLIAEGGKTNTANIYETGPILRKLCRRILAAGAMPILVHHFKKSTTGIPDLDDLSGAGVAEFARQWILLGIRESYQPDEGTHKLWLRAGGSAGHGGSWAVDVEEGVVETNFQDRKWKIAVRTEREQRDADVTERRLSVEGRQKEQHELACEKLLQALRKIPAGETKTTLRELAGIPNRLMNDVIAELLGTARVERCVVMKQAGPSERPYEGYRLAAKEPGDGSQEPEAE